MSELFWIMHVYVFKAATAGKLKYLASFSPACMQALLVTHS